MRLSRFVMIPCMMTYLVIKGASCTASFISEQSIQPLLGDCQARDSVVFLVPSVASLDINSLQRQLNTDASSPMCWKTVDWYAVANPVEPLLSSASGWVS